MRLIYRHFFLTILDLQALNLALFVTIALLNGEPSELGHSIWVVPLIIYISHLSLGLYESKLREKSRGVLRRLIVSSSLSILASEILLYALNDSLSLSIWLPVISLSVIGQWAIRHWLFYHRGVAISRRTVLVIGAGERAAFIPRRMKREKDRANLQSLCFVNLENDELSDFSSEIVHNTPTDWSEFIEKNTPDIIVLAHDSKKDVPFTLLLELKVNGMEIMELEEFIEAELGQIPLEKLNKNWLLTTQGFKSEKRGPPLLHLLLNKVLALLLFAIAWPFMLITAIAIYLDDGRRDKAPILYKQERVGKNGKLFYILKFRSMGKHAEKEGAQWAVTNDTRVTRIGGFLRKYRLDELPQLLNVLKGDMVFVGPRPERPEFTEALSKNYPLFPLRSAVTPGLTGWAQLKYPYGASENDSFEKLKFDLYYIKHRSILLDLFIMIRTVEIVLFGRGR